VTPRPWFHREGGRPSSWGDQLPDLDRRVEPSPEVTHAAVAQTLGSAPQGQPGTRVSVASVLAEGFDRRAHPPARPQLVQTRPRSSFVSGWSVLGRPRRLMPSANPQRLWPAAAGSDAPPGACRPRRSRSGYGSCCATTLGSSCHRRARRRSRRSGRAEPWSDVSVTCARPLDVGVEVQS
jgi:hypothetical protein